MGNLLSDRIGGLDLASIEIPAPPSPLPSRLTTPPFRAALGRPAATPRGGAIARQVLPLAVTPYTDFRADEVLA